jgi:activator of 2-hydroxyglutaryl-CoA dehydratase
MKISKKDYQIICNYFVAVGGRMEALEENDIFENEEEHKAFEKFVNKMDKYFDRQEKFKKSKS